LTAEVQSQQLGIPANLNRYLLTAFLTFLLTIFFALEKWFNGWEDKRKESAGLIQKIGEMQSAAIGYLFDIVLPNSSEDKVLDIIERFPSILGTITISGVRKDMASGFQIMGDAMTTISTHLEDMRQSILSEVEKKVSPIVDFVDTLTKVPVPKKPEIEELMPEEMR